MRAWRDSSPDRYGPINDGDYCVIQGINEQTHFIRVEQRVGFGILPAEQTACGIAFPPSMWDGPQRLRFPMGGVVDCKDCLNAMRED